MAGPVRQPIDLDKLADYIKQNVPEISLPIDVKQFGYGQSNPTYLLTSTSSKSKPSKFVLRKKPPGKLISKTAHAVEREFQVINALSKHSNVPVPKAYILCTDSAVLGTPFYIMEFVDGRIFEDPGFPGVSAKDRKELWTSALETLAKLHSVDITKCGLDKFGKHGGFYDRQVKTLGGISAMQAQASDVETGKQVGDIPHFEQMLDFFGDKKSQPKDRATVIHGDYKIDNLIYHKTENRVIGILDWEMSTIGHPLSDLSNLLAPYTFSQADHKSPLPMPPFIDLEGLPARPDAHSIYKSISKYDPSPDAAWGDAFGVFRNSVIMQGIAARYALRQASSARAKEYAAKMEPFGEFAWGLVQKAMREAEKRGKANL